VWVAKGGGEKVGVERPGKVLWGGNEGRGGLASGWGVSVWVWGGGEPRWGGEVAPKEG